MTTGLPRASLLENARFTLTYALPSLLRGALIPQPFWTELATRLNTGQWAVATVERLSERHDGRSLLLRGALGETLLILTTEDVRRVLDSPVEVFALDAREKQRALEPFAPDALNASPPSLRVQRRPFNEAVLDYGHEPHRFAERFLAIVGQEITAMLATASVLDYERSLAGFRRISRRCVLGDAAADDTELSEEHSRLREDGNWLGLKVWNRGRNARLRASMDERIRGYVDAAEPGTLVSLFPSAPQAQETHPNGQVPFWLMALDAVRTVVANTLALLATYPAARAAGCRGDCRRRCDPRPRHGRRTGGSSLRSGVRPGEHPVVAGGADARPADNDRHRMARHNRARRNSRADPRSRIPSRAKVPVREPVGAGDLARRVRGLRLVAQPLLTRRRTVRGPEPRPGAGHGEPRRAAATSGVRAPEAKAQPRPPAAVRDEPADHPVRGQPIARLKKSRSQRA